MNAAAIRVLIVDDEPPARRKVRRFVEGDAELKVVGEAGDGPAAIAAVRSQHPDLVLLDIQMPGADGFEVIEALGDERPHIIFITAFHEHAVRAFDVEAVDYLLKPFDAERFALALERAKGRVRRHEPGLAPEVLQQLMDRMRGATYLERVLVKRDDRSLFVAADQIDWIEAADNYVKLHTRDDAHLVRGTLSGLEERLDPSRFVRVSRGAIVNVDRIKELRPWSHGDRIVVLRDGTELTLSRRYRKRLPELFDPEF